MSCSMKLIQTLLFAFNFVFWLIGLALIILGAYIYGNYGKFFSYGEHEFAQAEFFIIAVGLIIFVLGFLGCCGAIKAHVCMISTFGALLIVIFILQVAAGVLGYTYRKQVTAVSSKALDRAVHNYFKETGARKMLDWSQETFHCCGNDGWEDYRQYHNHTTCFGKGEAVPSCHKYQSCTAELYKDGCHDKFVHFLMNNMAKIGGVALVTAFIQVVGIVFAFCLVKKIKEGYEQVN